MQLNKYFSLEKYYFRLALTVVCFQQLLLKSICSSKNFFLHYDKTQICCIKFSQIYYIKMN